MNNKLLSEWDYELNLGIDPQKVADQSNKKFYWKCPKGHPSYLMPMNKRYIGHGCPVCSNHKIIKGINDLTTSNPELMDELKRTIKAMEIEYYKPAVKSVRNKILSGKLR